MGHLHAELDPESHARVLAAVNGRLRTLRREQRSNRGDAAADSADPAAAPMTYDQQEAQAFVDVVTGSTTLDRRTPDVVVMIDLDTLRNGQHSKTVCETSGGTPLPVSTVRRLCCEANIVPAVLDGNSVPLDLGRSRRLASPAQRQAILTMYRTCGFPSCTTSIDRCEVHHTEEWLTDTGPTDLDKLVPLCCRHHHLVHEGGWRLTLGEQRHVTVHRPDGVRYFAGTTTNRQPTTTAPAEPLRGTDVIVSSPRCETKPPRSAPR